MSDIKLHKWFYGEILEEKELEIEIKARSKIV
jgi:hypothetical protein